MLTAPARLLAAADAYHAMTEPRPHRAALRPERAAQVLADEAGAGRLDADGGDGGARGGGQPRARVERAAGLTEREVEVIGLLARGLQTKEIARALAISAKTADRHIQNAYGKIGVSTRGLRPSSRWSTGSWHGENSRLPLATSRPSVLRTTE